MPYVAASLVDQQVQHGLFFRAITLLALAGWEGQVATDTFDPDTNSNPAFDPACSHELRIEGP